MKTITDKEHTTKMIFMSRETGSLTGTQKGCCPEGCCNAWLDLMLGWEEEKDQDTDVRTTDYN